MRKARGRAAAGRAATGVGPLRLLARLFGGTLVLLPFILRPSLSGMGEEGAIAYALLRVPAFAGLGIVFSTFREDKRWFAPVVLAGTAAACLYFGVWSSPSSLDILGGTESLSVDVVRSSSGTVYGRGYLVPGSITASDGKTYPIPGLSLAGPPSAGPHRLLVTIRGGWVLGVDLAPASR